MNPFEGLVKIHWSSSHRNININIHTYIRIHTYKYTRTQHFAFNLETRRPSKAVSISSLSSFAICFSERFYTHMSSPFPELSLSYLIYGDHSLALFRHDAAVLNAPHTQRRFNALFLKKKKNSQYIHSKVSLFISFSSKLTKPLFIFRLNLLSASFSSLITGYEKY